MLLQIAWAVFGIELLIAILFGVIFWYFWSNSAVSHITILKALLVYSLGCALCLLFAVTLPL